MQTSFRNNGQVMPLLMNFTPATPIEEDNEMYNVVYDEKSQIVYNMWTIGTKSLKTHSTVVKHNPSGKGGHDGHGNELRSGDKKNEIDDSKSVK